MLRLQNLVKDYKMKALCSSTKGDDMTDLLTHSRTEDYDGHGLPMRSCDNMYRSHQAHDWQHPTDGVVHCWGRNPLPSDAEEQYCEQGCDCSHCAAIRRGEWPRYIMCQRRWKALPQESRIAIAESCAD